MKIVSLALVASVKILEQQFIPILVYMYVNINYTTIDYRPFIIKYLITQSFGFIKIYVLVKIVGLALLTILKTISKN